jgi:hypothetical protein
LFDSWVALLPLVVPLTGLLLHQDHVCVLPVAGLWVLPQLVVKDGQLFVKLTFGFHELINSCPRWASVAQRRGAGSSSELLEAEAMQTLHSRTGSRGCAVDVLRVVAASDAAPVARRLLT